MTKLFKVKKAGRLANGAEKGKGTIIHLSENDVWGRALCGATPAIGWTTVENKEVTCPKCLKKGSQYEIL